MNGTSFIGGGALANPGLSWHVAGTGDFNGDGKTDILWQNSDGTPAIWEMNGTSFIGGGGLANPGPSWHVAGTGDFNGDGKADILWQNSDGTPAIWEMNGTSIIGAGALANPGPSWHVAGTGDFNGDGKADILWQNSDGTPVIWLMNGTSIIGGGALANPGPSWHVAGTGDFNGDGKADILWQNSDGTPVIWLMNGTSIIGGGIAGDSPSVVSATLAASPAILGSDSMQFISDASAGATLNATAGQDDFDFTSYAAGAHAISGFDPSQDLIELSKANFANFADLQAHSTASGGSTLIALDSASSLLIQGVQPSDLHSSNFVFE